MHPDRFAACLAMLHLHISVPFVSAWVSFNLIGRIVNCKPCNHCKMSVCAMHVVLYVLCHILDDGPQS